MDDSYLGTMIMLILCSAVFVGVTVATAVRCCCACKRSAIALKNDEENKAYEQYSVTVQEIVVIDEDDDVKEPTPVVPTTECTRSS